MEKKPLLKKWWFWVLIIMVIGLIFNPSEDEVKTETQEAAIVEEPKEKSDQEKIKEELANIIIFNGEDYKNSKEQMLSEIALFEKWSYLSMVDIPESKELKTKLIALQKKEFPLLRKAFSKLMKETLWENNIDVQSSGTSITLISGIYADNGSIKSSNDALYDILKKFRYKRVNYKWYEGEDGYTYYDIDSKDDSSL